VCCVGLVFAASTARAQTTAAQPAAPAALSTLSISGSIRWRIYSWNWFGDNPNGDYTYPAALVRIALAQARTSYEWRVEMAAPLMTGLPDGAVLPPPQGQLGLGASYVAANGNDTSAVGFFPKQAFFRWKTLAGVSG